MEPRPDVLQQRARVHAAAVVRLALRALDVPRAVRVARAHAAAAAGLGLKAAALHRHGLDLVIAEDHEPRQLARRAAHQQDVVDGDVEGEDLHLLDEAGGGQPRLVRVGGHLEDAAAGRAHEQHIGGAAGGAGEAHGGVHGDGGEALVRAGLDVVWSVGGGGHSLVHQRVLLDEGEVLVPELPRVVLALAGPGARLLVTRQRQPVGVGVCLALEGAVEAVRDVAESEAAHRAARDRVLRRVEDPEDEFVIRLGADNLAHRLDLIKIERIGPRHRAVEAGFQETCPLGFMFVRSAVIIFTHPRHSAVHRLQHFIV